MANKVNLDVSEKLDITCRRGDTFSLTLTLKDSSGTAIQLATLGYSFLMDVKTNPAQSRGKAVQREVVASSVGSESVSKVDSSLDNGFEFTDITDSGTVKVTASASVMSLFPVGVFTYDIQQNVDGAVTTILRGSFKVNEDISG
tara:strand:+ start:511 stop:942 length:432 start_codon:yes stop_codon:yes gene_type:complete